MKINLSMLLAAAIGLCFYQAVSQTQSELNDLAHAEFSSADNELSTIYRRAIEGIDPAGRKKLAEAQRAWTAFRDTEASLEADQVRGGTAASSVFDASRTELTREQIRRLRKLFSKD